MSTLVYGLGLFLVAFAVHLIIWRLNIPKNQTGVLLAVFLAVLLFGIIILWSFKGSALIFGMKAPHLLGEYFYIILFYISLTIAYIITYSAIEVDSPSLVMIMNIAMAGREGLDESAFHNRMSDKLLIVPRLHDLVASGMARKDENQRYEITGKGLKFLKIFMFYRKILKREGKSG